MISYLDSVRKLVDKSIYGRGLKTFLEGGVIGFSDLTIDSWRKYQVKDTNTEVVVIPLLHLVLSIQKWEQGANAIQESAFCSCNYFKEFGTCKHIVAVCASIEQEFIQPKKHKLHKLEIQSSLDNLFEYNNNQEQREWLTKIYQYFERSRSNLFPWISQIVRKTSDENLQFPEFWEGFEDICKQATQDFDQEKKLVQLIEDSMVTGSLVWWKFWIKLFPILHPTHHIKILAELWFQSNLLKHDYGKFLNEYLFHLDNNCKILIMQELDTYSNKEELKVQFALQSKMKDWLEKQMSKLDPMSLIEMAILYPDLLENIEDCIFHHLKIWADFLTPEGTEEIREVMLAWRTKIGDTSAYIETKKYLKESYPKRKKLWSDL